MRIRLFLVFVCIFSSIIMISQNLSIDETIKYINEKLKNNPFLSYNKVSLSYSISVSKDGVLYIYDYENNVPSGIKEISIKQIDIKKSFEKCPEKYDDVKLYCKITDGAYGDQIGYNINPNRCVKYSRMKQNDVLHENYTFVMFSNVSSIGDRICNAFEHLLKSVIASPEFFPSEKNDPFAKKEVSSIESKPEEHAAIEKKNKSSKKIEQTPAETDLNASIEYFNLGNKSKRAGNCSDAILLYNKAILINPKYAKAFNNLALCQESFGEYEKALENYSNAIKYNPSFYEAYDNRGLLKGKVLKKYSEAILDFTQVVKINPNYVDGYMNRGICYGKLNNFTQEMSDYNKAIQINPSYAEAYFNRGAAYHKLGKKENACKDFYKSWKLGLSAGFKEYHNLCELD